MLSRLSDGAIVLASQVGYLLQDGGIARRFWALKGRILVGGRILNLEDADRLRELGVTHVLSADNQSTDNGLWPDAQRARFPFVDNGVAPPLRMVSAALAFERSVLASEETILYCHCRLGRRRGPTYGYMALRVLGFAPSEAEKRAGHGLSLVPTYVDVVEQALAGRSFSGHSTLGPRGAVSEGSKAYGEEDGDGSTFFRSMGGHFDRAGLPPRVVLTKSRR